MGSLYAAFKFSNPDQAQFISQANFLSSDLSTYNLSDLMNQLKELIGAIMGTDLDAAEAAETEAKN